MIKDITTSHIIECHSAAKVTKEAAISSAVQHLADAVIAATRAPIAEADLIVRFPFGLERNAAQNLIDRGLLITAKIGRSRYVKQSELVKLIDILHAEQQAKRPTASPSPDAGDAHYAAICNEGANS